MRIATDIGGTFTDLVCFARKKNGHAASAITITKTDTTPTHFEEGILKALSKAAVNLEEVDFFAHGTTVVINAITERKGAKTALITTSGFRDVLEIARCNRPDLFNFNFVKQPPFVPRYLRCEVEERINYKGEVILPLAMDSLPVTIAMLKKEGVKAIAIAFLHAYKNPQHEIQVYEEVKKRWAEVEVICSHHVTREWREYERTSSTVLSAYVLPSTKHYLHHLQHELQQKGLKNTPYIMQSNGGITTIDDVKSNPISIIESGPASGVLGAVALGKEIGRKDLIVLDIGGTTAKCALIEKGQAKISTQYKIEHSRTQAGYPIQTPVVDIVEIGNGGGSIAWVDAGGKMHVGPHSAGAFPGPAAYGRNGKDLTTTDANIITGRIHPHYFLGGTQPPNDKAIEEASKTLCATLHMDKDSIAKGILRIANANMVNALKLISLNKGYDPRDFSLMVIGGGGGMHGAALASELNISEWIVPAHSGVFSALGMLLSDLRRDLIRTYVLPLQEKYKTEIENLFLHMKEEAIKSYQKDGYSSEQITFEHYADLRYEGQEHYVKIVISDFSEKIPLQTLIEAFHLAHKKQYTFRLNAPVELVNFHLVAKVEVDKPEFPKLTITERKIDDALFDTRPVDFDHLGVCSTAFYHRNLLEPNMTIVGPAIIAEKSATTVVNPSQKVTVDDYGNLIITSEN